MWSGNESSEVKCGGRGSYIRVDCGRKMLRYKIEI